MKKQWVIIKDSNIIHSTNYSNNQVLKINNNNTHTAKTAKMHQGSQMNISDTALP